MRGLPMDLERQYPVAYISRNQKRSLLADHVSRVTVLQDTNPDLVKDLHKYIDGALCVINS